MRHGSQTDVSARSQRGLRQRFQAGKKSLCFKEEKRNGYRVHGVVNEAEETRPVCNWKVEIKGKLKIKRGNLSCKEVTVEASGHSL